MPFTTLQLEALEAAIALGATKVKYADKEVEYRSLADMCTLRDRMRLELGQTSGTGRRYGAYSKGL